jgi:X-Pro dipeptidyl-peptidase (S15 family)
MPNKTRFLRSWSIVHIASATTRYERDALTQPYLAGHGYAGVRVDIRGSGELTGLLFDEYAKQEQDDGVEVIAWLAAQPWRNGSVGMMGISWGGFNRSSNCGEPSPGTLPAEGKFARLGGRERSVSSRLGSLYSLRFLMIDLNKAVHESFWSEEDQTPQIRASMNK